MAKEVTQETKLYGIVEVVETSYPQGQYPPDRSFEEWFHSIEWLESELAAAKKQADGRNFRPHTDWGWYLQRMIAETGMMFGQRARGDIDAACISARELGLLTMESKMKFDWETHALSGRKSFEGGQGTRKASDEERRRIVCEIIKERGMGARDAFRIAEQRFREIGSEASFKHSYYKKGV
jgi:hypothetical protein